MSDERKVIPIRSLESLSPVVDEKSRRLHILVEVFIRGCRAIDMTRFYFKLVKGGKVYTIRLDEEDVEPPKPAG